MIVPDGYRADVVLRWGDPLFADSVGARCATQWRRERCSRPSAAAAQARQFGYNCDGIGLFPLGARPPAACASTTSFRCRRLLFPGWVEAREARALGAFVRERPSAVAYMQAAVGLDRRRARARREVELRARLALQPAHHGAHGDGDHGPARAVTRC